MMGNCKGKNIKHYILKVIFFSGVIFFGICGFQRRIKAQYADLHATDYGKRLAGINDVWWCGSAHKVCRQRPLPSSDERSKYVSIKLARNEYEAIQVVVRPESDINNVMVTCSDLVGKHGNIQSSNVAVDVVGYVNITHPTVKGRATGYWPDPLPPLKAPIKLRANDNKPFWITVYAPKGIDSGVYKGTLHFSGDGWQRNVPFHVDIWDFTLSDETHIKSALNLASIQYIRQYHNVSGNDLDSVINLYYADYRRHRIMPRDIYGANIHVNWGLDKEGDASEVSAQQVKIDFEDFDNAVEKAIKTYRFNSFRIPLLGFGHFKDKDSLYIPGNIGAYSQGSEEYNILFGSYLKQIQHHLKQNGWLGMVFVKEFDEPKPGQYDAINQMGELMHRFAPGLKYFLTLHPSPLPKKISSVDIWCPLIRSYNYDQSIEMRKQGIKTWWYLADGPKVNYISQVIDRPALDFRLWLWQTWKNKVGGILIWNTINWSSPSVYPESLQNPWEDPASWAYFKKHSWGNGNARFLYPPNLHPNTNKSPIIAGPVNSIRWELLRDGIEDYEYFWTLQQQVNKLLTKTGFTTLGKAWEVMAKELLQVPGSVSKSPTDFTGNPSDLMTHRTKIAKAIVAGRRILNDLK